MRMFDGGTMEMQQTRRSSAVEPPPTAADGIARAVAGTLLGLLGGAVFFAAAGYGTTLMFAQSPLYVLLGTVIALGLTAASAFLALRRPVLGAAIGVALAALLIALLLLTLGNPLRIGVPPEAELSSVLALAARGALVPAMIGAIAVGVLVPRIGGRR
ncbi:MAG: hypothetical protein J7484_14295 [Microbacterium sp.]|nr:hypothetical protein [Microbacterium sp.]